MGAHHRAAGPSDLLDRRRLPRRTCGPEPEKIEDWWPEWRALFERVASIGARHTSTPDRAWFALWDGRGYANFGSRIAWSDPPADEHERRARTEELQRLSDEDDRRNTATRAALRELPSFDLPDRTYYLLTGAVTGVGLLRDPATERWRNPDLFWRDDRRWFVATDVDIWSLHVGGEEDLLAELAEGVPTSAGIVSRDDRLVLDS